MGMPLAVRFVGNELLVGQGAEAMLGELPRPRVKLLGAAPGSVEVVPPPLGSELPAGAPVELLLAGPRRAGFDLHLWSSPQDLAEVVIVAELLAASPRKAGEGLVAAVPGIRLDHGAPVTVIERDPKHFAAKVRFVAASVPASGPTSGRASRPASGRAFTGWVSAGSIGRAFPPGPSWRFPVIPSGVLPAGAPMSRSAGGPVLAQLPCEQQTCVVSTWKKSGKHALVSIAFDNWSVLGWVPQRKLVPFAGGPAPAVPPAAAPAAPAGAIKLAAGAPLLAAPGGALLGTVATAQSMPAFEISRGHTRIRIALGERLGQLDAWVPGLPSSK